MLTTSTLTAYEQGSEKVKSSFKLKYMWAKFQVLGKKGKQQQPYFIHLLFEVLSKSLPALLVTVFIKVVARK